MKGHTPLFGSVQRWLRGARLSPEQLERAFSRVEPSGERLRAVEPSEYERRALESAPPAPSSNTPRIVIVGAGIAGLSAAYHLRLQRLPCTIYESSRRVGGRIYSEPKIIAPELTIELGGEFINSDHADMLRFARLFKLDLIDTQAPAERKLQARYFFEGSFYSETQILEAMRPLATQIARDAQRAGDTITYQRHTPHARTLDNLSIAEYLQRIGARGWIYSLLTVAYTGEYGLDADEQSALNLIMMIDTDLRDGFSLLGDSDERYKIRGGMHLIPKRLAEMLKEQIRYEHQLVALRARNGGYQLTFERPSRAPVEVDADFVILTLPFTRLREVDLQLELPPAKRRAIQELGYGLNAKLILGFQRRFWRAQRFSGNFYTDEPFQCGWDSSRLQAGRTGALTLFVGGAQGRAVGRGMPTERAAEWLDGLERLYTGAKRLYTGDAVRFHWPSHPHTRGSYSCWKVGQYTQIAGAEFEPVGNLYFAGEHTSLEFQGYMNGAAETGRRAAQLIARRAR